MVRIQDHYAPTNFMVLEKKKMIHPSSLEDRSSTPPTQSSMLDLDKSTSSSLERRYAAISIVIPLMNNQRNQLPKNEWEEDEEPVKDEPTPLKTSP